MKKSSKICRRIISIFGALLVLAFLSLLLIFHFYFPSKYNNYIMAASQEYQIDDAVIRAVIWTESRYRADALSSKGAVGLMQLLPSTAEFISLKAGLDSFEPSMLYNPSTNISLGVCYLRYLLDKFEDEKTALAAYNAGEGNVLSWQQSNQSIPFKETQDYVDRVTFVKKIYTFKNK